MAAVVIDDDSSKSLRAAVHTLRSDFDVPSDKVLSWKEYVKTHERRRRAAEVLGRVDGLRLCYVYSVKSELREGTYKEHPQRFYNYVALKLYKSILWAARDWKGVNAEVWTRFGHVHGHDHNSTKEYISAQVMADPKVPSSMEKGLRWVSSSTYDESQAADLYGGFLKSAIWPSGKYAYTEPSYLISIWHQIRNSSSCAIPLGIMSMPKSGLLRQNSWFPCAHCTK